MAALASLLGPPAKKFVPPPIAVARPRWWGTPGTPYATVVKLPSTVQLGIGTAVALSVAPAAASPPGLASRLPVGTAAWAAGLANSSAAAAANR